MITKKEFEEFLDSFGKEAGEFTEDELYSIGCKYKELPLSEKKWDDLAKLLGVDKTGESFRTWIKSKQYEDGTIQTNVHMLSGRTIKDITFPEYEAKVDEINRELYKQQVKTRDVMNGYRRAIRDEARVEIFKEALIEAIKNVPNLPKLEFVKNENQERTSEGVICLNDWHWGTEADNFVQKVNNDILRKRLRKVIDDTKRYCETFKVETLHILGLADFIAGNIHQTIRIEQQMDVAQQVIESSEALAEVLNEMQTVAPHVYFHQVTGNHDRMIANKAESIERESYCKLTWWYLQERLKNSNIVFADNQLDESLGMFELKDGRVCCYEHGHLTSKQSAFQNACAATKKFVSFVFLAHFHSSSAREYQGCRVFVSSSLVGPEDYAISRRLIGDWSQKFVIFESDGNIIDIDIKSFDF